MRPCKPKNPNVYMFELLPLLRIIMFFSEFFAGVGYILARIFVYYLYFRYFCLLIQAHDK